MAREVIVLSGPSGAGKSVTARRLVAESQVPAVIVSADDLFRTGPDGAYVFEPELLGEAHDECFRSFLRHLVTLPDAGLIIVDNTNTTAADMAPYMRAASAFGWSARVLRIVIDPKVAAARNGGRAPAKVVEGQARNMDYQNLPAYWNVETVQAVGV